MRIRLLLPFTILLSVCGSFATANDNVIDMREAIRQASPSIVQVIHEHSRQPNAKSSNSRRLPRQPSDLPMPWRMNDRAGESISSGITVQNENTVLTVLSQRPSGSLTVVDREGGRHEATVRVFDEVTGCVLLNVEGLSLPPVAINAQPIEPGLPVATLWARTPQTIVVGQGIVATLPYMNSSLNVVTFETDIAIGAGASGGAVVDPSGNCIGVIFASLGSNSQGTATALPVSALQPILDQADSQEQVTLKSGMMGIRLSNEDATVEGISNDSAAEAAGFELGDKILRIAGQSVGSSRDVQQLVRTFRANDKLTIDVQRNDQELSLELTLQPMDRESTPLGEFLSEMPGGNVLNWWLDGKQFGGNYPGAATPGNSPYVIPSLPHGTAELMQPPRYQVERSDLEESIRALRGEIDRLREELKQK